jgi:hypothetical protein
MPAQMQKELRAFLHGQVVSLLIFWLVLFAPVTCQFHGLLIPLSLHQRHGMTARMLTEMPAEGHQMALSMPLPTSLFVAMLPDRAPIALISTFVTMVWLARCLAKWPPLRPPDQPPRRAN